MITNNNNMIYGYALEKRRMQGQVYSLYDADWLTGSATSKNARLWNCWAQADHLNFCFLINACVGIKKSRVVRVAYIIDTWLEECWQTRATVVAHAASRRSRSVGELKLLLRDVGAFWHLLIQVRSRTPRNGDINRLDSKDHTRKHIDLPQQWPKEEYQDIFDVIDDDVGEVTTAELTQALRIWRSMTKEEIKTMVDAIDEDGSGAIDFEEFRALFMFDRGLWNHDEELKKTSKVKEISLLTYIRMQMGTLMTRSHQGPPNHLALHLGPHWRFVHIVRNRDAAPVSRYGCKGGIHVAGDILHHLLHHRVWFDYFMSKHHHVLVCF